MYDYGYGYGYDSGAEVIGLLAGGFFALIMWLISMAISIFTLVCMWKVFKKAGKPGWASIVPVYNIIVMLEIAELPMWYIILFFIPFVNIYAAFKTYIEFAHKFGKSTGFGVGMVFLAPIFLGILAFSKDVSYVGSAAQPSVTSKSDVEPAQQSTPSFCANCGSALISGAQFCTNCGKKV